MKNKILIILSIFSISLLVSGCGTRISVEYPVFPNTKEGRQLKKFVGTKKNVAVVVEKPSKGLWSQIFSDSSFIDQIPARVFTSFDTEGYYKLVDASKRAGLMNEISNSMTGLTAKRLQLGNQLQADMFLYIGYEKPVTSCNVVMEKQTDSFTDASGNLRKRNYMVYTGERYMLVPLKATLIATETGATMHAVSINPVKVKNSSGSRGCPDILTVFDQALNQAAADIRSRLSPLVKTLNIKIITKDEDPEVAEYLQEGYEEASGETPSMDRALKAWQKAERLSRGKSEGAIMNIGAYHFASGNYEEAIKYFEKGMALKTKNRMKFREYRKKAEAVMAVSENKNND